MTSLPQGTLGGLALTTINDREEQFGATIDNLCLLVERHLENIPFKNLAQHVAKGGLAVLDIAEKVLDRRRGGICFEPKGLFAHLLSTLVYQVKRIPSVVHKIDRGFDGGLHQQHMVLLVRLPN